jgi:hypothetical protein
MNSKSSRIRSMVVENSQLYEVQLMQATNYIYINIYCEKNM